METQHLPIYTSKATMSLNVQQLCSKLVKPIYNGDTDTDIDYPPTLTTPQFIPLTVFDYLAEDENIPIIFVYKPPTPSIALLEQGLRKALTVYPEWAGRFSTDDNGGNRVILLNNEGLMFIEASTDCTLDQAMPITQSTTLLSLTPSFIGVKELALVQLTSFTCGSLVVCFAANHMVSDGVLVSKFLVAWGQACRGLEIHPQPSHDRQIIIVPRDPCRIEFDHTSVEVAKGKMTEEFLDPVNKPPHSKDDVIFHKAHFAPEFIAKVKSKANSCSVSDLFPTYSTFESLVAHSWKVITIVRGLTELQTTEIRISVNGRRRLKPPVPDEYFGNLVLWAYPAAKVNDLFNESLSHIAEIIHEAVAKVNDDYFKSFIDFAASYNIQNKELMMMMMPEMNRSLYSLWPNLEFISWLGFPFDDIDFGVSKPCIFVPPFVPVEGIIYLVPSFTGDGGIDVYITLFQQQLALFQDICYSID